jgi:protein SCO1
MIALRPNPRLRSFAAILLVLLMAAAAAAMVASRDQRREPALAEQTHVMKAGIFDPPEMAPDFSLPGSDGSDVTLARYRGKVVLLTFGFTYCAAVCPTTMSTLAQAHASLGQAGKDVQVIFVTVDPARDDAASMRTYLAAFDPTFVGATGEPAALAKVREKYGVTAVRQGSGPDYAIAHTSSIFLIDREGRLRAMMPFGHDAGDFVHDVRILMNA